MSRLDLHLFVCINERSEDDPRGSCVSRGSANLLDYLKKRVHDAGLKGKVRVNKAGCLDACAQGPAMVVYPQQVWYIPKTEEDIEEIFQEHVLGGKTVDRLLSQFPPRK